MDVVVRFGSVRHRWFYLALAVGVTGLLVTLEVAPDLAFPVGVNLFFAAYLGAIALASRRFDAAFLRRHAEEEDAPAWVILLVMLAAVAASTASLVMATLSKDTAPAQLGLGVASVLLGWFAVHTMWALHYAFQYYQNRSPATQGEAGRHPRGGLDFPGGEAPDGMAFVYFAYVIGMTAQTSDTAITSREMRRLATVHGVFSFLFNTVIVASAVNIVASLAR